MKWFIQTQYGLSTIVGKKFIFVGVQKLKTKKYVVLALETPQGLENTKAVFDHHAHKIVAENVPTLREAKALGEAYVRQRQSGKRASKSCKCPEVK